MGARPKIPALTSALFGEIIFTGKDAALSVWISEWLWLAIDRLQPGCRRILCAAAVLARAVADRCCPEQEVVTCHSRPATLGEASTSGHVESIKVTSPFLAGSLSASETLRSQPHSCRMRGSIDGYAVWRAAELMINDVYPITPHVAA